MVRVAFKPVPWRESRIKLVYTSDVQPVARHIRGTALLYSLFGPRRPIGWESYKVFENSANGGRETAAHNSIRDSQYDKVGGKIRA